MIADFLMMMHELTHLEINFLSSFSASLASYHETICPSCKFFGEFYVLICGWHVHSSWWSVGTRCLDALAEVPHHLVPSLCIPFMRYSGLYSVVRCTLLLISVMHSFKTSVQFSFCAFQRYRNLPIRLWLYFSTVPALFASTVEYGWCRCGCHDIFVWSPWWWMPDHD